jgi:hypothetical protein
MAAYSSAGRVPLVIWAATVDPADVPMMRSASVTSTPASDRPAMRPSSQALPAAPPPARTKARLFELAACLVAWTCWSGIGQFPCHGVRAAAMPSDVVVELMRGVEEGVVFTGVALRGLPVGRSHWRLPQSRDRGRRGSTHYGYRVHGSHLLLIAHDQWDVSTPATRRDGTMRVRSRCGRAVTAAVRQGRLAGVRHQAVAR